MTVSCHQRGAATAAPVAASCVPPEVGRGVRRQAIEATLERRECTVEGYLQRKLHRQWRNRGS
ncbi:hypothetical protein [Mycolicibacter heraklionensis]|uniref:hypothetical protein n=1 Tax=Mycolicibacter heraklionensis TaxID=512402 RepID=UPI00103FF530|nr:hypothetical protein [Mycolicibacter heraklionensis]